MDTLTGLRKYSLLYARVCVCMAYCFECMWSVLWWTILMCVSVCVCIYQCICVHKSTSYCSFIGLYILIFREFKLLKNLIWKLGNKKKRCRMKNMKYNSKIWITNSLLFQYFVFHFFLWFSSETKLVWSALLVQCSFTFCHKSKTIAEKN